MTQAITQTVAGAAKATMVVREAEGPTKSRRPVHAVSRSSGPALKQPTFNWKAQDKYDELKNFKMDVINTFIMNSWDTEQIKKKCL